MVGERSDNGCSIRFGVLRGAKLRQPSGALIYTYTYVILLSPALFQICPSFEAIYTNICCNFSNQQQDSCWFVCRLLIVHKVDGMGLKDHTANGDVPTEKRAITFFSWTPQRKASPANSIQPDKRAIPLDLIGKWIGDPTKSHASNHGILSAYY